MIIRSIRRCRRQSKCVETHSLSFVTLFSLSFQLLNISCSSPSWLIYVDYLNSLIVSGIQATVYLSLKNLLVALTDDNVERRCFASIVIQLNDRRLSFDPTLDRSTSQLSIKEIVDQWMEAFVLRAQLVVPLGNDRTSSFVPLLLSDPLINELKEKIDQLIDGTCQQCEQLFRSFDEYSFLYELPVNQCFELFLHGHKRISSSPPPKNFLQEQDAGRRCVHIFVHLSLSLLNGDVLVFQLLAALQVRSLSSSHPHHPHCTCAHAPLLVQKCLFSWFDAQRRRDRSSGKILPLSNDKQR